MKSALRRYRRHFGWLLLVSFVMAVAMGWYTFAYEPNFFQSTVEIYALPSGDDGKAQYDAAASDMLARDARQLLKDPALVNEVEEKLSPDTLEGMRIWLEPIRGTHILRLTARGTDASLCQTAATAMSVVLMEKLQTVGDMQSVSVSKGAQLPETPAGPRRVLKTLCAFGFTLAGLSLLWFLFGWRSKRTYLEDAVLQDMGVPVLGGISDHRSDLPAFFSKKGSKYRILSDYVNRSTLEDVRALSFAVQSYSQGRSCAVAVASCHTDEGKSSLLTLLATELCRQGKRVLIIDMDCYAPSQARLLRTQGRADLVDYLAGEVALERVIQSAPVKDLFFIDSLHTESYAAQMVASEGFRFFMETMYVEFDYILVDTPPISLFSDAIALGSVLDATLMIAGEGRVKTTELAQAISRLKQVGNRVIGLAFTYVKPKRAKEYRDYEHQRNAAF